MSSVAKSGSRCVGQVDLKMTSEPAPYKHQVVYLSTRLSFHDYRGPVYNVCIQGQEQYRIAAGAQGPESAYYLLYYIVTATIQTSDCAILFPLPAPITRNLGS